MTGRRPTDDAHPDLDAIVGAFPNGPTRGALLDWAVFHCHKTGQRLGQRFLGREKIRPHRQLLSAAVERLLSVFGDPVCVETGCIRRKGEGTDSTLGIATALGERGALYTFELEPAHIEICKQVCSAVNHRIRYIEGDSKANLRRLRDDGTLEVVHLAFFDSGDDPELIMEEFRAIEQLFVSGSIVVVDDVIPPSVKGKLIKPYLHGHPLWDTRVVYTWRGMLVAVRRGAGKLP